MSLKPLVYIPLLVVAINAAYAERNTPAGQLIDFAIERTAQSVRYDGAYLAMAYPKGDVPLSQGVCTDLIIRAYRSIDIDLQELVHDDMQAHFAAYPSQRIWGLQATDRNIDHRRVPNLQAFLQRQNSSLPVSDNSDDYAAGDLVTWRLPGNLPHIGIVTDKLSSRSSRPLIVHNIGAGPVLEDMLFNYPITGHYRFGI